MNIPYLKNRYDTSLKELEAHIEKHSTEKPTKLGKEQIYHYNDKRGCTDGWEICPPRLKDCGYKLHVFVDSEFPFSLPKVAVAPPLEYLKYPHIERDGYLCLDADAYIIDENNFLDACDKIIEESLKLILACLEGANTQDFKDEIISYWERSAKLKDKGGRCLSLLDPFNKETRIFDVCLWRDRIFVSEKKEVFMYWLRNKGTEPDNFDKGILLWLAEVFESPASYPKNARDLYNIMRNNGDEEIVKYFEYRVRFGLPIFVIMAFHTKNGIALIGVHATNDSAKNMQKGFRPGHVPFQVALTRYSSSQNTFKKLVVQRVDPSWVLSRDSDCRIPKLIEKRVAIIGCGAVGSSVARLLAQAGVGCFQFIDHDSMQWENIGRHALGASLIENGETSHKTDLLKEQICIDFPHVRIDSINKKWEKTNQTGDAALSQMDLIVSATGSWPADNALNQYANTNDNFPPIIYGWAEAFACAGHALCIFKESGCLDCVFNNSEFKFKMTRDFENEIRRLPGCSLEFQPFGNIDLTPITAMIAEICVNVLVGEIKTSKIFSWIGNKECATKNGGFWSGTANGLFSKHRTDGYFRTELDVDLCDACKKKGVNDEVL